MPKPQTFGYTVHEIENGVRKGYVEGHDVPKLVFANDECDAKVRIYAKLAKDGKYDPDTTEKKAEVEILFPFSGK